MAWRLRRGWCLSQVRIRIRLAGAPVPRSGTVAGATDRLRHGVFSVSRGSVRTFLKAPGQTTDPWMPQDFKATRLLQGYKAARLQGSNH